MAMRPKDRPGIFNIFFVFLGLGLSSFGGPWAHLAYFRTEFVARRRWLTEHAYAELVALCQLLPGPTSSQVGMGIGLDQGGFGGMLAAWLGFTLPSALLMVLFGLVLTTNHFDQQSAWLHGLKLAAVAVVAHAVLGMARSLDGERTRVSIAAAAALGCLLAPGALAQLGVILASGIAGAFLVRDPGTAPQAGVAEGRGHAGAALSLGLFLALLLFSLISHDPWLECFSAYYRSGALVFGGGHVVLPLLHDQVVARGWVDPATFLAGYGAAQALPGPLFSFAAFLGEVSQQAPNGWTGAAFALAAIYLPSALLLLGVLPLWSRLRGQAGMRKALAGVNAGVVGLLLAALYSPLGMGAVLNGRDFGTTTAAFVALEFWGAPPLLIVALAAGAASI